MVAGGRASPVQLVECALAVARAAEPAVNAFVSFLDDDARRTAETLEREARGGHLRGPLHGVPIAIKDNLYLGGHPVSRGSRTGDGKPVEHDTPIVARLRAAGAIIVGKTTMPEFGWKGTGISPLTGVTRNPWNTDRNPGGSSAGSAATVATGAVPIALGSDAGGSIRIPASFCGAVGLKPTLGRIPVWPGTVTETLSHVGPLCLSVLDAKLVLGLTAGADPRDPLSYAANPPRAPARSKRLRAGSLRVGVMERPFGIAPAPGVARVVSRALDAVRRRVRASFYPAAIAAELPRRIFETFWIAGRGHGFADTIARHRDIMDPGLVRVGALAEDVTLGDIFGAVTERRRLLTKLHGLFEDLDVVVMPTMPITAFRADAEVPDGGEADAPLPWVSWTPYTYCFNLSGQPAISIPCGRDDEGLPVGLQMVAPWGCDDLLLSAARAFERALGVAGSAEEIAPAAP